MDNPNTLKMKSKERYITASIILLIVLLNNQIFAFGVGAPYHENNPLKISPGESKIINFNFQNPAGKDLTVRPSIKQGSEIIEFIDSSDFIVAVGDSVNFNARITIPSNAQINSIYPIEVTFTTIEKAEEGRTLGLGASVGRRFNVEIIPVVEEIPREEPKLSLVDYFAKYQLLIILLLLIIILIWFILKKKNSPKKSHSKKYKK